MEFTNDSFFVLEGDCEIITPDLVNSSSSRF